MSNSVITSEIKLVASLSEVKHRRRTGYFKVEGTKAVGDMLPYFQPVMLLATAAWLEGEVSRLDGINPDIIRTVTRRDLDRMTSLSTPPEVIALFRLPEPMPEPPIPDPDELLVTLDGLQDPGNLGTIVRTCDWFGVRNIVCSIDTVDVFNPKTVQATMGALSRVRVHYADLEVYLRRAYEAGRRIYTMMLEGESVYSATLSRGGILIMGNEGRGVRDRVAIMATDTLTIPSYPQGCETSESLNVAVATAITLALFRQKA